MIIYTWCAPLNYANAQFYFEIKKRGLRDFRYKSKENEKCVKFIHFVMFVCRKLSSNDQILYINQNTQFII